MIQNVIRYIPNRSSFLLMASSLVFSLREEIENHKIRMKWQKRRRRRKRIIIAHFHFRSITWWISFLCVSSNASTQIAPLFTQPNVHVEVGRKLFTLFFSIPILHSYIQSIFRPPVSMKLILWVGLMEMVDWTVVWLSFSVRYEF